MEIEIFYKKLEEVAEEIIKQGVSTHEYLEELIQKNDSTITDLINFRKEFVDSGDQEKVMPYLVIGFFNKYSGIERITCFLLTFEIDEIRTKNSWKKRCELYSLEQPLFIKEPTLFDFIRKKDNESFDLELIDFNYFEQINESEIVKYRDSYSIVEYSLNPTILTWANATFSNKSLYVRLNPYEVYDQRPDQKLFESILVPANPNWWKKLTIYNRTKEGASYVLDDCTPKENPLQYWELHIKNINRLEVIAKRNNSGNLSMMIEEITGIDHNGILIGRMIHLDSDNEYGHDFENAILNHLDLAINIYEGENAKNRLNDNLANGNRTTDASYRTHLLRIEDIPFKGLFGFVTSFFRSKILINEWFEDQFRENASH